MFMPLSRQHKREIPNLRRVGGAAVIDAPGDQRPLVVVAMEIRGTDYGKIPRFEQNVLEGGVLVDGALVQL